MPQGHNHHENKRDKRNTRFMQIAKRERESRVAIIDRPVPLIDIGEKRISEIIKSVTGEFEDSFQDAWVRVIEIGASNEKDIINIARECCHNNANVVISEHYKLKSIDKPIGNSENSNKSGDEFTLKDILPSPIEKTESEIENDFEADIPEYRGIGKYNLKGNTQLDEETLQAIRSKYPHTPINRALRTIFGLKPIDDNHRAWQLWEDAILRKRYPWGGTFACMVDINRPQSAIRQRANKLGLHLTGHAYKLMPEWLRENEVTEKLGVTHKIIKKWLSEGFIESIDVEGHRNKGNDIFVKPEALRKFIETYPYLYDANNIRDGYRQYIPPNRGGWFTIKEASLIIGISQTGICKASKRYGLEIKKGWLGSFYIRLDEVKRLVIQPYPIISTGETSHYLFHTDEYGHGYTACRKHKAEGHYEPSKDKFPTCLLCLRILGEWRKNNVELPIPGEVYKTGECLICRQPQLSGKSLCREHDEELYRLFHKCVRCNKPRIESSIYCETHKKESDEFMRKQYESVVIRIKEKPVIRIKEKLVIRIKEKPVIRIKEKPVIRIKEKPIPKRVFQILNSLTKKNYRKPTRDKKIKRIMEVLSNQNEETTKCK